MQQINASIITIGDELLIGQTIDTNSAFISQELNKIGIWVKRRIAIGDEKEEILNALEEQSKDCDVIIITGGLGPTADDITKPALCEFFDAEMIVNEEALENVKAIFTKLNKPVTDRNMKQADVPNNCIVLQNKRGTAPGMWFSPSPTIITKEEDGAKAPSRWDGEKDPASIVEEETVGYRFADPSVYKLLKDFSKENRNITTQAEEVMWEILKTKGLEGFKFRRQHIIDSFIGDFVCLKRRLIIEIDGLIHNHPQHQVSDKQRTEKLEKIGFRVIRFTNEQVLHDTNNTLQTIVTALKNQPEIKNISGLSSPTGGQGAGPVYISLPGVPHEMKGILLDSVLPKLKEQFELPVILHKTSLIAGKGESEIAEIILHFETNLPPHIKLAYLPAYGMVRLRLTAKGGKKESVEKDVEKHFSDLKSLVKEWLVADEDITLQEAVINLLKEKKKTISTAESCTGGYIAHLITSISGSSEIFNGSVVSYSNDAKEDLINVKSKTLKKNGAVSEETVKEMVQGVRKALKTDYAVATSGIMGPGGGSDEKPAGTVWIAVANKNRINAQKFFFRFDRARNTELTAHTALNLLRRFVLKEEGD